MPRLSRRISLATHSDSGAESQQRALMYRLSPSNRIQTSVYSVASVPASGSVWMNPDAGKMSGSSQECMQAEEG